MADTVSKLIKKTPEACSAPGSSFDPACVVLRHLNLNLLTTEQKTALRNHLVVLTVRDSLLIIFAEFTILGSLLLAGRLILERNFQSAIEQTTSITRTFSGNNREIQSYNAELDALAKVTRSYVPIGDIYGDILAVVPPGISLSGLDIDVTAKKVKLQGNARTRDGLNSLRDALVGMPILANVQSPLSNLFVKEDIPFEFTADLQPDQSVRPVFIPRDQGQPASSTTSTPQI